MGDPHQKEWYNVIELAILKVFKGEAKHDTITIVQDRWERYIDFCEEIDDSVNCYPYPSGHLGSEYPGGFKYAAGLFFLNNPGEAANPYQADYFFRASHTTIFRWGQRFKDHLDGKEVYLPGLEMSIKRDTHTIYNSETFKKFQPKILISLKKSTIIICHRKELPIQ